MNIKKTIDAFKSCITSTTGSILANNKYFTRTIFSKVLFTKTKKAEKNKNFSFDYNKHFKIWFSKDKNKFMEEHDKEKLMKFRRKNPRSKLSFVYSSKLLSNKAIDELLSFCKEFNIDVVDFNNCNNMFERFPYQSSALTSLNKMCFNLIDSFNKGEASIDSFATISDIARTWMCHELGIYSDLDVELDPGSLSKKSYEDNETEEDHFSKLFKQCNNITEKPSYKSSNDLNTTCFTTSPFLMDSCSNPKFKNSNNHIFCLPDTLDERAKIFQGNIIKSMHKKMWQECSSSIFTTIGINSIFDTIFVALINETCTFLLQRKRDLVIVLYALIGKTIKPTSLYSNNLLLLFRSDKKRFTERITKNISIRVQIEIIRFLCKINIIKNTITKSLLAKYDALSKNEKMSDEDLEALILFLISPIFISCFSSVFYSCSQEEDISNVKLIEKYDLEKDLFIPILKYNVMKTTGPLFYVNFFNMPSTRYYMSTKGKFSFVNILYRALMSLPDIILYVSGVILPIILISNIYYQNLPLVLLLYATILVHTIGSNLIKLLNYNSSLLLLSKNSFPQSMLEKNNYLAYMIKTLDNSSMLLYCITHPSHQSKATLHDVSWVEPFKQKRSSVAAASLDFKKTGSRTEEQNMRTTDSNNYNEKNSKEDPQNYIGKSLKNVV